MREFYVHTMNGFVETTVVFRNSFKVLNAREQSLLGNEDYHILKTYLMNAYH